MPVSGCLKPHASDVRRPYAHMLTIVANILLSSVLVPSDCIPGTHVATAACILYCYYYLIRLRNHQANYYRSTKLNRIFQHFGRLFLPGTFKSFPFRLNEVVSQLPLNRLERLEWKHILWYPHKKLLLIGDQNRIDSKRSHPA